MRPLTSLVKRLACDAVTCTYCGSTRVTTVSITLTDGSPVDFTSCHRCEGKRWSSEQDALPLASVLERSRKRA